MVLASWEHFSKCQWRNNVRSEPQFHKTLSEAVFYVAIDSRFSRNNSFFYIKATQDRLYFLQKLWANKTAVIQLVWNEFIKKGDLWFYKHLYIRVDKRNPWCNKIEHKNSNTWLTSYENNLYLPIYYVLLPCRTSPCGGCRVVCELEFSTVSIFNCDYSVYWKDPIASFTYN